MLQQQLPLTVGERDQAERDEVAVGDLGIEGAARGSSAIRFSYGRSTSRVGPSSMWYSAAVWPMASRTLLREEDST